MLQMTHIPGHSTNNSVAAMLDSDQTSSSAPPSSGTNSLTPAVPVTTAPTFTLSKQDLTRAFSQALGDSLPQILAALQSHSMSSGSTTRSLPRNLVSSATSSSSTRHAQKCMHQQRWQKRENVDELGKCGEYDIIANKAKHKAVKVAHKSWRIWQRWQK